MYICVPHYLLCWHRCSMSTSFRCALPYLTPKSSTSATSTPSHSLTHSLQTHTITYSPIGIETLLWLLPSGIQLMKTDRHQFGWLLFANTPFNRNTESHNVFFHYFFIRSGVHMWVDVKMAITTWYTVFNKASHLIIRF